MSFNDFITWLDKLGPIGNIALFIYVWLSNRHRVTGERIGQLEDDMDERLDVHGNRLTRLEVSASAAPTHEDLKRLHQRLYTINGELNKLSGESTASRHTLELIHEHLLNGVRA